jgi:hypothetical protein
MQTTASLLLCRVAGLQHASISAPPFLSYCCTVCVLLPVLLPLLMRLLSLATQLAGIAATLVFYAPPHGLGPILADMVAVLGGSRRAVVARELTKLHEEFYRWALRGHNVDTIGVDIRHI